jgi:TorA maturation chaperone TorD
MGPARRRGDAASPPLRLAELARFRQAAYRLFGEALRPPEPERVRALAAVASELDSGNGPLASLAFSPAWSRFLHALAEGGGRASEEAFVRLFVADVEGICPPAASHYLAPEAPALVMAYVEREYALAGLSVAAGLAEPPDHAAVELDFMSLLCGEEADAWSRQALEAGAQRFDREATFLDRHLCRWFPEFARRVANRDPRGFYALVTDTARAFLLHDLDLVTVLSGRLREVAGG